MRVAPERIVPLGYGKYVRSDRISAVEPIEEGRGPGRRTRVWIEDVPHPFIASRSETAIVGDMAEGAEDSGTAEVQRRLLHEVLESLEDVDPVLRRIVRDQARWDLDRLEQRIRQVLGLEGRS